MKIKNRFAGWLFEAVAATILAVGFAAAVVSIFGCATTQRGKAIQGGQVAKEVVDIGAETVDRYLAAKSHECEHLAFPGNREALEACLGPVASSPDEIDAAFESVRSAQLALFIALGSGATPNEVNAALADLWDAVGKAATLIKKVQGDK